MGSSCRKPSALGGQLYGKECSTSLVVPVVPVGHVGHVVPMGPVVVPVASFSVPAKLGQPMSSDGRCRFKWTCVQAHQSDLINTMWQDPAANLFFPAENEDALINQRFYYWRVVEY